MPFHMQQIKSQSISFGIVVGPTISIARVPIPHVSGGNEAKYFKNISVILKSQFSNCRELPKQVQCTCITNTIILGKNDSQVGSQPSAGTRETLGGHLHFIWDTP